MKNTMDKVYIILANYEEDYSDVDVTKVWKTFSTREGAENYLTNIPMDDILGFLKDMFYDTNGYEITLNALSNSCYHQVVKMVKHDYFKYVSYLYFTIVVSPIED